MSFIYIYKLLSIFFICIIALNSVSAEEVNVYSARKGYLLEPLIQAFEKDTGIKVNIISGKAKATGNYLNSMLALQDALSSGYDEALILDTENTVNEGSGENFFIVKNETLITPGLSTVLDGITRKTIIQLAADLEISTEEKKIELDEVYNCDEAFFTGTAAEVTPIIQINNESIGNRKPGKITSMLQENYFKLITGRYNRHSDWLTII